MALAATRARLRRAYAAPGGGGSRIWRALRGGTSLGLLAALAAAACDTDTIDLLPKMAATGSSGGSIAAGASTASPTRAGSTGGGSGGSAGSLSPDDDTQGGANEGGGPSFGGRGPVGSGGSFGWPPPCLPGTNLCSCTENEDCQPGWHCAHADVGGVCQQLCGKEPCKFGFGCDTQRQRCEPSCASDPDCDFGRVCDPAQSVCVQCVRDDDCDDAKDPAVIYCDKHRCVECREDVDCTESTLLVCANTRCSECESPEDCGPGRDCDTARGRCY